MIERTATPMPPEGDPTSAWRHVLIEFTDPTTAEHVAATTLAPALERAELRCWWFLRKSPAWRLRYQPARPATTAVDEMLDEMADVGQIARWTSGIYEPETLALGGPPALDIAHTLFHHDSRHVLARADEPRPGLGRCETTVLLFGAMLRAAGLDWFEQGDVWDRVAVLRPAARPLGAEQGARLETAMRRLMTTVPPDPLLPRTWSAAFDTAGHHLGDLARAGRLRRGLRAVLAHHFIFHANRAGLSAADQATLAALAVQVVFHTTTRPHVPDTTKVPA
ncbi:MAG: thiopeptide-type bacteriocin biosynthesis protein [Pseudonocardia sp.]|nr:thiopeptide-type bacteriocin biosynthesis protein [Pseudonocardia sp.]